MHSRGAKLINHLALHVRQRSLFLVRVEKILRVTDITKLAT